MGGGSPEQAQRPPPATPITAQANSQATHEPRAGPVALPTRRAAATQVTWGALTAGLGAAGTDWAARCGSVYQQQRSKFAVVVEVAVAVVIPTYRSAAPHVESAVLGQRFDGDAATATRHVAHAPKAQVV